MLTRRRLLGLLLGGVATLLAACAAAIESRIPRPSLTPVPSPTTAPTASPTPSPRAPAEPSLHEAIAGMLLVGFRGLTPRDAEPTVRSIAEEGLGGVLLFSVDQPTGGPRNIASPEQLTELTAALRGASAGSLIVAVDQEGGRVARLGPAHGFPDTRSAASLGATGDPSVTRVAATEIAASLHQAGITLNLAPVVDLAVNPDNSVIAGLERSFGADPATVVAHAAAFIEAHHAAGVRCAIKHFPGQGSATGDTHLGVVDVTDEWTEVELQPFAQLIAAGLPDAVMTAHIHNDALDPDRPATLSAPTLMGLLRERIGWEGPILSDDLQMGALTDRHGYDEVVALAIESGVDLLLIANQISYDPDVVARTIGIVESLVASGRVSEERIRASWRRLGALRRAV
jgi:beta-N-acetylhexosaminidase